MKILTLTLIFTTALTGKVLAQNSLFGEEKPVTTVEQTVEPEVIKHNHLPIDEIAEMSTNMDKTIENDMKNLSPAELSALVKFNNHLQKTAAEAEGETFEKQEVDTKDLKQVREFYEQFKPNLIE